MTAATVIYVISLIEHNFDFGYWSFVLTFDSADMQGRPKWLQLVFPRSSTTASSSKANGSISSIQRIYRISILNHYILAWLNSLLPATNVLDKLVKFTFCLWSPRFHRYCILSIQYAE